MDFSRYGIPSKEWLALATRNPGVAQEGKTNNGIHQAESLRQTNNCTRELVAEKMMTTTELSSKVAIKTLQCPSSGGHNIPIRHYTPRENAKTGLSRALILFHGGGMLFGTETTDDVLCSSIAVNAGVTVLSVIYRHTPQYQHPAQHDDAWDAFQFIQRNAKDIGVDISSGIGLMGTSAGGGLAAGVLLRDSDLARATDGYTSIISGLVLSIPWLIHIDNYPFELFVSSDKSSKIQCQDAPVVPADRLRLFTDILASATADDPLLNAAMASDFELDGWPRTAILVAGMDPLRDDGLILATRLRALGIPTSTHVFPGLPHGFKRWDELEASKKLDVQILASLRWAMALETTDESTVSGWHEHYG